MRPRLRLARLTDSGRIFYALLEGDGHAREIAGDPFAVGCDLGRLGEAAGGSRTLAGLEWLPPFEPSKIIGIGRNYRAHATELRHAIPREPLLFLKPSSSLLPPEGAIRLPQASRRIDFEGELGVVIGRMAKCVPEHEALDHVLGYTCVNDVTARDLQDRDVQFTRAKGFDTFCPAGPCVATGIDPSALVVETFVNGVKRQSSPTSNMIFSVEFLVSFVSRVMTLRPGDLIATGTPGGVGPLRSGDEVSVSIDGIGRLTSRVERPRD